MKTQLPVLNKAGEPSGNLDSPSVFVTVPHAHAVYLAVKQQRANARVGSASTKTKGEVRGGGKKPWRQKHTGRARQGSIRAPQWRGGGIVFGPKPRTYHLRLPAKVRRLALRSVLSDKIQTGQVAVLEALDFDAPKTKHAAALLKNISRGGLTLVVLPQGSTTISRAFRNLPGVRVQTASTVSVYDLLCAKRIVVLKDALESLTNRCGLQE